MTLTAFELARLQRIFLAHCDAFDDTDRRIHLWLRERIVGCGRNGEAGSVQTVWGQVPLQPQEAVR